MLFPKLPRLFILALMVAYGGQTYVTSQEPPVRAVDYKPERVKSENLPNLQRVTAGVLSGGLPEGEAAFAELKGLGVKTIISVDGAKPDVAAAKKFGLRYVHLPHGYSGIEAARAEQLAKAVADLDGPIYIHCHHGKHRSPAAAAVACIGAGLLPPEAGEVVLKTAGTSAQYRGLYEVVARTEPIPREKLDRLQAEFRETELVPPFAEAMVRLEHTFSQLKLCVDAGWKSPANQPALTPGHEALILREHYTEMRRTEDVAKRSVRFRELLTASEMHAKELETLLVGSPQSADKLNGAWGRISADCATCHREFRDVPLRQKSPSK